MDELSDRDADIIRFSDLMWHHRGARENEIVDRFDMSVTAYFQRLAWLIDQPAAEVAFPTIVHRHQRIRDEQRRLRGARGRVI